MSSPLPALAAWKHRTFGGKPAMGRVGQAVGWVLVGWLVGAGANGSVAAAVVDEDRARPILMRHCWSCHGPGNQEAELDLRDRARMLRGGQSGPALVPGDAPASLLIRRIRDGACPPNRRLVEANVKPVPEASLQILSDWIAQGALEPVSPPDGPGAVAEKDRAFWAFQPPTERRVPTVRHAQRVRNDVDAFILEKLEARGLEMGEEASKETLLRRVYFDLIGLPPSPEDVARFLSDSDPRAYENLIERLLALPEYGERWGRHWLDVAGYADVEGKREQHMPRLFAYRYRDYVIRAFAQDKPYDVFLREQLAGDELEDVEGAAEVTEAMVDRLAATGFLRMGPDPTWANITGFIPDRLEVIGDAMDVLGSGVMGLTLKCARCHDHKLEPVSQRDYYRMTDLFKGALDEFHWLKPDRRPYGGAGNHGPVKERILRVATRAERQQWLHELERGQREIDGLLAALATDEEQARERYRKEHGKEVTDEARAAGRRAWMVPPAQRSPIEQTLAADYEKRFEPSRDVLHQFDPGLKKKLEAIAAVRARRPHEPGIAALWDRGEPSPTYVYLRGDSERPGPRVTGGVPAILSASTGEIEVTPPWPGAAKTGRRLALARWLTQPNHPLTARVWVNRVWRHHFGRGLVRTLDNFGRSGAVPSHPELLDWLAREFVRQGWRTKSLHRLLLTSSAYRQSSRASDAARQRDPENQWWSRMPLRRLEAEVLWDSVVRVAGALDAERFGPPVPVSVRPDGAVVPGQSGPGWRRSIYGQQVRKDAPSLLDAFDLPTMNPNCMERAESIVATQALHLMNDAALRDLAGRFAQRLVAEAGPDWSGQIDLAFRWALSRPPSEAERADANQWQTAFSSGAKAEGAAASTGTGPSTALTALALALLNSAEFLYVD